MSVNYDLKVGCEGPIDIKKIIEFFVERGYGLIEGFLDDSKSQITQFTFENAVQFLSKGDCIFLRQTPLTFDIMLRYSKKSQYPELANDTIMISLPDRVLDWPGADELYKDGLDRAGIKQMVKDFVKMMKQVSTVKSLKEGLDFGSDYTYVLGEKTK